MSSIYDLCKKYTQLMDSDIEILIDFEKFLPLFSEAQDCDVFIDCSTSDSNAAIVVAEYRPENSLYNNSVVGMYAERKNEPAALRTLETGMPTRGLKGLNQENKAIIQNVSAIRNEKNEVIGVFIMERDETEVFNKEFSMDENTALRNQISNYESNITITKYLDDAIIYFNDEGTAIYSNPKANKLFKELGYRDRLIGMRFHNLVYGDIKLNDIIKRNYIEINRYPIGNGVYKIKYYTIYDKDTKLGIAMILNDLTDIHKIEKELILKTVDIKEIHHRVKNNLQTIASLLRLQERRLNESEEKKILRENINRIISIALTHEILAQNGEDEVSIKEIIERLITYISQASLP